MTKSFLEANADTIKTQLKELAKGIKSSNDPETLEFFRKLIKKSLSFAERKYLAAYILTNHESILYSSSQQGKAIAFSGNQNRKEKRSPKENNHLKKGNRPFLSPHSLADEKKEKAKSNLSSNKKMPSSKNSPKNQQESKKVEPKAGQKTLFISIGKNRKVFPADLQNLFTEALGMDASQLGEIKIFPKYSFIDLPDPLCNIAIDKLSNIEFHGIKIKVNYSKSSHSTSATTPTNHEESKPITVNDQILE